MVLMVPVAGALFVADFREVSVVVDMISDFKVFAYSVKGFSASAFVECFDHVIKELILSPGVSVWTIKDTLPSGHEDT